jgi:hypothetical protein
MPGGWLKKSGWSVDEQKMTFKRAGVVMVCCLVLTGCGVAQQVVHPYDAAGAGRLAAATGLASDTPPGFVLNPVGVTPNGGSGPALVPVPGQQANGPGGYWTLGDGGIGLSEEAMITFYTERMMQHHLRHITVTCSEASPARSDSLAGRTVFGVGSSNKTRFLIHVQWAGSVEKGWHLNQEIVTDPKFVDEYPAGQVLEYRCRFINPQILLNLAAKYGYIPVILPPPKPPSDAGLVRNTQ